MGNILVVRVSPRRPRTRARGALRRRQALLPLYLRALGLALLGVFRVARLQRHTVGRARVERALPLALAEPRAARVVPREPRAHARLALDFDPLARLLLLLRALLLAPSHIGGALYF